VLVTMLGRSVLRATAEHESSVGLDLKHVMALSYLRELGAVGQKYFGAVLSLDSNSTVLLLNELEADGLVVRRRDPDDRRRHVVEVTAAGLEMLSHLEPTTLDIENGLLAALSDAQRSQLHALVRQALYGKGGVLTRLGTETA
jgi:DNA-binding MarR family transcriptional regulator